MTGTSEIWPGHLSEFDGLQRNLSILGNRAFQRYCLLSFWAEAQDRIQSLELVLARRQVLRAFEGMTAVALKDMERFEEIVACRAIMSTPDLALRRKLATLAKPEMPRLAEFTGKLVEFCGCESDGEKEKERRPDRELAGILRLPLGRRILALGDFLGGFEKGDGEVLWGCIGRCDGKRFFEACLVYFGRFSAAGDEIRPLEGRLFRAFRIVRELLDRKVFEGNPELKGEFAAFLARA
jgi:hypothetical protein